LNDKKAFWEEVHKKNTVYWLTDSDPDYVYKLHDITQEVAVPRKNILEIGVGTGKSIIHLKKLHNVYAVDIAEAALEKVKDGVITIQVNDQDRWPKNIIDIALCHLVFQHCNDNILKFVIKQVLKSLVLGGFFTFQSADADEDKLDANYIKLVNDNLMFFRKKNEVTDIIKELGGKVIKISTDILHPNECDIIWNIFRVVKVED
jgi:SAM-dependent methyltransferase